MEVFKSDQISTVSSFHSTEILKKEQKLDHFESAKCSMYSPLQKGGFCILNRQVVILYVTVDYRYFPPPSPIPSGHFSHKLWARRGFALHSSSFHLPEENHQKRMGCMGSSQAKQEGRRKRIHKPPPWEHPVRITRPELQHMREEFWDTAPHYGGSKAIWDALRAAAETEDLMHAQAIIEGAGIIVENNDLTVCYDEKGEMYELPNYVLREPSNLIEQDVEMGTQNPQPVVDHHSTALQS
ncbi:hypothetical protein SAY87_002999 [Trapa incisa]|uniref:DC-UbP/UBTD2 N-terminal domain-containing protein n=1 Tax=Trapa incisa TaxID=236973 RepID=A0AAN7KND5_9MYRT|nr:hypothetical protein SAY87_002999 [Trapa incisa]